MGDGFTGDFCCEDPDLEWRAFSDQLPEPTYGDPRHDSVREAEPSPALKASRLFEMWRETGKLLTRRPRTDDWLIRAKEMETLLEAYKTSESLGFAGADCADFRDAIVDAIAEVFDEWGIMHYCPWKELFTTPLTHIFQPLRGLFAFRYALDEYPRTSVHHNVQFKDKEFEAMWRAEFAKLPDDKTVRTNMEIWETFMKAGRCRFHTHAGGRCWRAAEGTQGVVGKVSDQGIKSLI